jgi:hypothetical protein
MFLGIGMAILAMLLRAPTAAFATAFIGLLAASNALINPIMTGLEPLTKATPSAFIKNLMRDDPSAAWAAYESNPNSEFLMALGANVVTGVKTVPDLEFYKSMDPSGDKLSVYNRYSFSQFIFRQDRSTVELQSYGFPTHVVRIHPLNPALRARNVNYFVLTRPLRDPAKEGLTLLGELPENRMWIYGVTRAPAVHVAAAL